MVCVFADTFNQPRDLKPQRGSTGVEHNHLWAQIHIIKAHFGYISETCGGSEKHDDILLDTQKTGGIWGNTYKLSYPHLG